MRVCVFVCVGMRVCLCGCVCVHVCVSGRQRIAVTLTGSSPRSGTKTKPVQNGQGSARPPQGLQVDKVDLTQTTF